MNRNEFVHLHLHTEYSLLDGACRIDKLFEHIKSLGQTAVAITDHGNMYGVPEFYKQAKQHGIKPIIGCEVYVARRTRFDRDMRFDSSSYHLILLCKNMTGYKNLIKLVSLSNSEGFYSKPRVDLELLEKYSDGLVCLSACLSGEIARKLLNGDYVGAKNTAEKYRNIFGDDYYIEIQNHGISDELSILPQFYKLSAETGIPLVASNDCHYISKSDYEMQKVLLCIQLKKNINEPTGMGFEKNEFYVKSTEEMQELFRGHEEVLTNTLKIAEKCNFKFEFEGTRFPEYKIPNINNIEFFRNLCTDGMYKKYKNPSEEVLNRLEHELDIIIKMGYVDYYLIVWDFIKYARDNNIPVGPGRGSGAGSLCAYCIGITSIDPIKNKLIFERFLNTERGNMPDFDIDFCIEGRAKVKEYVVNRYGTDKVAEIIAFGTLKAHLVVQDVGRVLNFPYQLCEKVSELIGNYSTLKDALEHEKELLSLYNSDEKVHKLIDVSLKIEGMPRHVTTHPAGVVISSEPLADFIPLQKNDETVVTQYTMNELETMGFLKMDFLGIRNLTVIRDTVNQIKDFDISSIPVDDKKVYEMMSSGNLSGIFQFESKGMKNLVVKLKPKNLNDLTDIISLYRPGPMDAIPQYINNCKNPKNITYKHPMLEDILKDTYGCILYQEQVIEIFRKLAGFSYGHADSVRHAMSKKQYDEMMQEKDNFISGAVKNGVSFEIAKSIFEDMESFALYAFNKSHATAYAYLAYQTAYLKCHYFKEYMSSLMSSVISNNSKLLEYISLCRSSGTKILKPDINVSEGKFTVSGESIYFGLCAIKNVGNGMIERIIFERKKGGKYRSFQDFCERTSGREINKRAVENMIKAGAFDGLDLNRHQMLENYENIMDSVSSNKSDVIEGQLNLWDITESVKHNLYIKPIKEYDKKTLLKMEKDATGLYLSGNPLDEFEYLKVYFKTNQIYEFIEKKENFKNGNNVKLICSVHSVKPYVDKSENKMCFMRLEDETGEIESVVFSELYRKSQVLLKDDEILFITGHVSLKDGKISIISDDIISISDISKIIVNMALCIKMTSDELKNFEKLKTVFANHHGKNKICIYLTDLKKKIVPRPEISVSADENLYNELKYYLKFDKIGLIKL